jgi:hypothetical protein
VVSSGVLVDGLSQPLPLEMGPDGIIFAGQFGADLVTALVPLEVGYWRRAEPVGEQILDAGSGELNGLMYVISGKTPGGYVSDVHVYDPNLDIWVENVFDAANVNDDGVVDYSDFAELSKFWGQPGNPPGDINFDLTVDFEDLVLLSYVWLEDGSAADLIGGAVENPAVVSYQGRLYVFGGSTSAFSGAVSNAGVYDPVTNQWRALSDMPAARGGACACQAGGMIYVIGGMDSEGNSLGSVDVYDPNGGSWVGITDMQTRRDNPGCAGIDGKVYVFGGRTRDFDGTETDPALQSVEMYDPQSGQWVYKADMPTGRRTMVVGRLNGRVQLIGGENSQPGASLDVNEEYDPSTDSWRVLSPIGTGRHGAAGATVGDVIVVTGGGPVGGTSFTSSTEIFSFGDAQQ